MTDEEYEVVLDNTVKEIAAQQKWIDDQKAAFDRVLQTRRDLAECKQQLAEARAALKEIDNARQYPDPHGHNGLCWGPWGWECFWRDHAAALKAAREAQS